MAGPFSKYQDVAEGFNVGEIGGRPNGRPVGVLNGQGQAPNQFSNPALGGMNRSQVGIQPMPGQVPGTLPINMNDVRFGAPPARPWDSGSLDRQNPTLAFGGQGPGNMVPGMGGRDFGEQMSRNAPVSSSPGLGNMIPGTNPVGPATPPWLKTATAAEYKGQDQAAREAYNAQMNQQKALVANRPALSGSAYKALGTPERESYNQQMTLKNNMALQEQRRAERTGSNPNAASLTPLQQRKAAIAAEQNAPGQNRNQFAARQAADQAARQANRASTRRRTWGGQVR